MRKRASDSARRVKEAVRGREKEREREREGKGEGGREGERDERRKRVYEDRKFQQERQRER